jgi:hypothetical protein
MNAISAALEPAHDNGALPQVDVIPAQIASLRDPQTMAVDDQPDQPIPVTVPVALEGGQQLVHLGLGQVLPDPVGIVPLASITAPQISAYNLAVPTYPEQIAIAAVLTDMDVELTALERRRGKTRALKQALLLRTGAAAFLC